MATGTRAKSNCKICPRLRRELWFARGSARSGRRPARRWACVARAAAARESSSWYDCRRHRHHLRDPCRHRRAAGTSTPTQRSKGFRGYNGDLLCRRSVIESNVRNPSERFAICLSWPYRDRLAGDIDPSLPVPWLTASKLTHKQISRLAAGGRAIEIAQFDPRTQVAPHVKMHCSLWPLFIAVSPAQ